MAKFIKKVKKVKNNCYYKIIRKSNKSESYIVKIISNGIKDKYEKVYKYNGILVHFFNKPIKYSGYYENGVRYIPLTKIYFYSEFYIIELKSNCIKMLKALY